MMPALAVVAGKFKLPFSVMLVLVKFRCHRVSQLCLPWRRSSRHWPLAPPRGY